MEVFLEVPSSLPPKGKKESKLDKFRCNGRQEEELRKAEQCVKQAVLCSEAERDID
jgi:hypothetical protein